METESVELELVKGVWQVDYDGKKGSSDKDYPKVKVGKGEGPAFIDFTIKGSGNAKFSAGDPIWVNDNGKPQGKKLDHDQIAAWKVQPGAKKLLVFDWNDRQVDIHYKLNFDNAPALDPIIENGGGVGYVPAPPPPPSATDFMGTDVSALQILAAVLLFLVGVMAGRMWQRRAPGKGSA